jgi:hypothetical protein
MKTTNLRRAVDFFFGGSSYIRGNGFTAQYYGGLLYQASCGDKVLTANSAKDLRRKVLKEVPAKLRSRVQYAEPREVWTAICEFDDSRPDKTIQSFESREELLTLLAKENV